MTDRPKHVKPSSETVEIPKSALVALAVLLAPLVASVLASSGTTAPDVFTSRDGERPQGFTRRRFAEWCRKIPSARLEGKDWIVPRADWFALVRRPPRRAVEVPAPLAVVAAPAANDADALLAGAGLRATRRAS